ncbi:MAG: hypothetical protein H7099_03465 [Gemmatimonadaceae bacterium]|nr:hypothetical protein [Gemmatimonadaceae bacterium]
MILQVGGAVRALVTGLVDYAGLFPPAALDMSTAVANYAHYRASDDAWMLGRFVVPVSRLDEWSAAVGTLTAAERSAWSGARLSALLSGEFSREAEQISAFNAAEPFGVRIDVAEGRTATPDAVLATAAAMPDDVLLYCELPHREDPLALLQAVKSAHVRAKIRTGGVTRDAFPTPHEIIRFLRRCVETGVTAKATAGLHHPLRGEYRLTYAPDAVRGTMYGYLNVFLAAAAVRAGASDDEAVVILLATDPASLAFASDGVVVAGISVSASAVAEARRSSVVAFGSCSFLEPVEELGALLAGSARVSA